MSKEYGWMFTREQVHRTDNSWKHAQAHLYAKQASKKWLDYANLK